MAKGASCRCRESRPRGGPTFVRCGPQCSAGGFFVPVRLEFVITISHAEFNRMVKEFHGKKVEKGKQSWLKLEPFRPK